MMREIADDRPMFLATLPASRADWRMALAVVAISTVVFIGLAPIARVRLAEAWGFIPVYQTALAITDLMTAGLLFAQFSIIRSRALLVLACGYLFTAALVIPHTLSFPGLFASAGLLGGGSQTTAWLYMLWHGGFPLAVIAYALLKGRFEDTLPERRSARSEILIGLLAVAAIAGGMTLLATVGHDWLPLLMSAGRYTSQMYFVNTLVWSFSLVALLMLWVRRPHTALDLWLMVVSCAWLFDIALSAVLNGGRFDLGFYAGRIYGFIAAAFVLLMMQIETGSLYLQLSRLLTKEQSTRRREAETRRRLFDTSNDLILVSDRKGTFQQVSPSVTEILGYRPGEMVGRSAIEFLYPADLDHTRQHMRAVRRGRSRATFETRYVHRDGRLVTLGWTGVWSEPEQQHYFIGRDMTEQKAAERAVNQALARQQAVFNAAMVGIVTLNESGSIETLNPAAARMFGVGIDDVARRDIGRLIDLGGPSDISSAMRLRHLRTGESGVRELAGRRSDGSSFPLDFELAEMPVGDRRMFIAFVRDITERKRNARLKNEFVATVSHELRTPLTSIAGSLGLLVGGAGGQLSDQAKRLLTIAHSNSQRLVRLINDILDIEKIETGKVSFASQQVELRTLADQAIEANRGFAESFGVPVRLDADSDQATVRVDPDRLTQVIVNLLSNAAKFSPWGQEVVVRIENSGARARLTVRDHGPGVPPDYAERIFEKFVQVDASDTRQKGGTGLGLSIVREIMLRLDGEAGYRPAPGGGSIFWIELPCWDHIARLETEQHGRAGNALILLCEDDRDAAAVLAARLRAAGFPTDVACTAEEAVKAAATRSYAAILVDLQLPDTDGISLIKQLREQPQSHNTPIVVVSADPSRGRDDQRSSALNVLDWLAKPVDTQHLVRVLNRPIVRDGVVRPRVLHVDDDRDVLNLVAQALGPTADVVSVESIDEARHVLDIQQFDLAVLDVALAEGFGLDLLPDLRGVDGQPIPVVVFSAQDSPEVSARVLAVLSKSRASMDSLVTTLRRLVTGRAARASDVREVA